MDFLLCTSLTINNLKKSWWKTFVNLCQIGNYLIINICYSWWKKNCHTFPKAYPQKKKPSKRIQVKVISYINSIKNTPYIIKDTYYQVSMNIIFLKPGCLPGRNDVISDKANFRQDITQNLFFEKKSRHQEFVWLLKQFGAIVP